MSRPSALRRRVSPRSASVCPETCRSVNSSPQRSQSHFLLINRALAFCQRVFWVFLGGALRMLGAGVAFQAVTFVKGRA